VRATTAAVAAALAVLAAPSATAEPAPSHAGILTVLAQTGTIYYRCDTRGNELGIHISSDAATTYVTFRVGKRVGRRELQPEQPTSWFPYRRAEVQSLATASGGEGGSVLGHVKVDFWSCGTYWPPSFHASLRYTRR